MGKKFIQKKPDDLAPDAIVFDMAKPTRFSGVAAHEPESGLPKRPRWGWPIAGLIIGLCVTVGISLVSWWYISRFERSAGVPALSLIRSIREGWQLNPYGERGRATIAVMGLDAVDNRSETPELTDTIMLVSLTPTGRVFVISLPRDLWIQEYDAKINMIYALGQAAQPPGGAQLTKEVFAEVTGLTIDYTLVVKLETLAEVIDAVGGVDIEVPRAFTDDRFPRANVDLTSNDPTVLYETVKFEAGFQHFDGATAVKYIRTRHSQDPLEGNDLARIRRQQAVITGLVHRLGKRQLALNPELMGKLYHIWKNVPATDLTDAAVVGLTRPYLSDTQAQLSTIQVPVDEPGYPGILKAVSSNRYGQWVFEPIDPTWKEFRTYISEQVR